MSAYRDAPGNPYALTDDRHHLYNARARLKVVSEQLRQDVARVSDDGARAMLEVSVAVLNALVTALHAHEEAARVQWRKP